MTPTLIRDVHVMLNGEDHYVTAYYTPGSPAKGASFECAGGYPEEPDEIDIQRLQCDDKFVPAPDEGPDYDAILDAIREADLDGQKQDDEDDCREWNDRGIDDEPLFSGGVMRGGDR